MSHRRLVSRQRRPCAHSSASGRGFTCFFPPFTVLMHKLRRYPKSSEANAAAQPLPLRRFRLMMVGFTGRCGGPRARRLHGFLEDAGVGV